MRKITLLTMLVAIQLSSYSQFTVKPKAAFDALIGGYDITQYEMPQNTDYNPVGKHTVFNYRTRLGVDFSYKNFTVNTDIHTFMDWANEGKFQFAPRINQYYIGISYKWKNIKLHYEHMCMHPVKNYKWDTIEIYGSYDMVSISYNY